MDAATESDKPKAIFESPEKINQAVWGPLNQRIFAACADGTVTVWDVEVMHSHFTLGEVVSACVPAAHSAVIHR